MRSKGSRDFRYPAHGADGKPAYGLVVPRITLDGLLARQAAAAGAMLQQEATAKKLILAGNAVRGLEVSRRGRVREIGARVVVAADGATSPLARQLGLVKTPRQRLGYALRAYLDGIDGLGDLLEFFMPPLPSSAETLLPSYGWVFPTGPASANVGVGLFEREGDSNVRALFAQFLRELRERDPRFESARQSGGVRGAPLRFDFAPDSCWAPGLLLVGDAAGMISPFTGEGISYALESGKLAAEVIDARLDGAESERDDWSEYAAELRRRHGGYFETGRRTALRYRFAWRVLESTFQSDAPLFALARRGALVPEGVGGIGGEDLLDDIGPLIASELRLRPDLITVGELLADTVRREWPFLARLYASTSGSLMLSLRPSVLSLIASRTGKRPRANPARVAAVVELGALAALAQASVDDDCAQRDDRHPPNWGNMFAVMVGDVLLARSLALVAGEDAYLTQELTSAIEQLCESRSRELRAPEPSSRSAEEQLAIMARSGPAAGLGIACALGTAAGDAAKEEVAALSTYGRELGLAYQLLDEARRLDGGEDRLGRTAVADLDLRIPSFPVWAALARGSAAGDRLEELLDSLPAGRHGPRAETIVHLVRESGAVEETQTQARRRIERALSALGHLPDGPRRRSLERVGGYVAEGCTNGALRARAAVEADAAKT
jgi:menaquinone-9 beta-reductase